VLQNRVFCYFFKKIGFWGCVGSGGADSGNTSLRQCFHEAWFVKECNTLTRRVGANTPHVAVTATPHPKPLRRLRSRIQQDVGRRLSAEPAKLACGAVYRTPKFFWR